MILRGHLYLLLLAFVTQAFAARIQSAAINQRNAKRNAAKLAAAASSNKSGQSEMKEAKQHSAQGVPAAASAASLVNASSSKTSNQVERLVDVGVSKVNDTIAQEKFVEMSTSSWVHKSRVHESAVVIGIGIFLVVLLAVAWKVSRVIGTDKEENARRKHKSAAKAESRGSEQAQAHLNRYQHFHGDKLVYEWAQTEEVAKIYIKTPDDLTSDDLEIFITPRRLSVGRKGKPFFINEATHDVVDVDESAWRLCTAGELQIHMAKETPGHWPMVLVPEADAHASFDTTSS